MFTSIVTSCPRETPYFYPGASTPVRLFRLVGPLFRLGGALLWPRGPCWGSRGPSCGHGGPCCGSRGPPLGLSGALLRPRGPLLRPRGPRCASRGPAAARAPPCYRMYVCKCTLGSRSTPGGPHRWGPPEKKSDQFSLRVDAPELGNYRGDFAETWHVGRHSPGNAFLCVTIRVLLHVRT